ncbi:dihydroorotase [hydrocarbon metagenome]|uniref:Dihydroorotase n=1 Tax=hydrocarbon metagenome TaxID=938273 RepID=A0A0W8E2W6_9ZZZZ
MRLLVKGGRVIDPANELDEIMDVFIEDGIISKIDKDIVPQDCEVVDAAGMIVCPGFIDMHVHLRDPGYEYKEDIATGTRAAAVGGFTSVCCMPNTDPVVDSAPVVRFIREKAEKAGVVNVFPIGSISKKQEGKELSEVADLLAAGCVAISDDGKPVKKASVMRNALEYTKMFGIPVLSHCEDLDLSHEGQMHEGYYSTIYGLKGIPAAAEELMVARDIRLAELTGGHIHLCHVSTRGSIELVRTAREKGINVSCEVTPHHLTLSDEILGDYDTDTKVNPPLRSAEHIEALIEALQDGTVDCIATDHAPHHREAKDCEFQLAAMGISGLETAVAVIMDRLVGQGLLDIFDMVRLFTCGPAEILGLERGTLDTGRSADITIIDPEAVRKVLPENFYSKGKNTPFKGMVLKGWPVITIVNGKIVAREGNIV